MTKELKWRLGKLPTPDEVLKLVNDKLITKEEAREILFNEEEKTERDVESLKEEIKFLKEIIEKLSNNNKNTIVETIRYIERPYKQTVWYPYYVNWCGTGTITSGNSLNCTAGGNGTVYLSASGATASNCSFTDIRTF